MTNPADSNGSDPLDAVVADYLQRVEAGTPPDREALVAAHPDLADRLRAFFADLDRMGNRGESFRLPEVALPEDFGDYEFLDEIGRGGMGVVYRARQKSLNRIVALKMILSGPLADASALRRFREEAEALSRLDHPRLVPVYEVGEHRGLPYFTTKLIEGESLTRCLDRYAGDPKAVAVLMFKVCGAVHHAHQRGVLHRDLKPGNIVIDAAGQPHVTDFGLSRRVEETRTLTSTGAVLGTPEYMSPEQAAGKKDVTVASDVYGLGAVLHALLTGKPPFQGATVYDTLRRVIEDEPVPPDRLVPGTSPALASVCLKCLQKEPARRYATVAELADDLQRYLLSKRVAARPPGRIERLYRWARRKPTAAALYATSWAAALLLGVSVVIGLLWRDAENARDGLYAANKRTEDEQRKTVTALDELTVAKGKTDDALGALKEAKRKTDDALGALKDEQWRTETARQQAEKALGDLARSAEKLATIEYARTRTRSGGTPTRSPLANSSTGRGTTSAGGSGNTSGGCPIGASRRSRGRANGRGGLPTAVEC
jgi:eukaryotic-like serine/threonine-protein kinase